MRKTREFNFISSYSVSDFSLKTCGCRDYFFPFFSFQTNKITQTLLPRKIDTLRLKTMTRIHDG